MAVIRTERIHFTPDTAQHYLDLNTHNRPVSERHLARLAAEMTAGRFKDTGVPIIVYAPTNGATPLLEDGQHRLMAIIASGIACTLTVTTNDESVYDVVDRGKARTLRDAIALDPLAQSLGLSPIALSSATSALVFHDTVQCGDEVESASYSSTARIAAFRAHHEDVAWAARLRNSFQNETGRILIVPMLAGALAIRRTDATHADAFWRLVVSGEGIYKGDAQYLLRKKLLRPDDEQTRGRSGVAGQLVWYEFILRCWNAYAEGRSVQALPIHGRVPKIVRCTRQLEMAAD